MNVFDLPDEELRKQAKLLKERRKEWPEKLTKLTEAETPEGRPKMVKEIWRCKEFLAQVFDTNDPNIIRISVNRTLLDVTNRRWRDGITWEDLMEIKLQLGYGEQDAVEVLPAETDIVNVANMRHIFVFAEGYPLDFIWRKGANAGPGA
jgi:hypothetical protein